MISKNLLERLLRAFPSDAEKIKKHAKEGTVYDLRVFLLEISGVCPLRLDFLSKLIDDFKKGNLEKVNLAVEKMREERMLISEII